MDIAAKSAPVGRPIVPGNSGPSAVMPAMSQVAAATLRALAVIAVTRSGPVRHGSPSRMFAKQEAPHG